MNEKELKFCEYCKEVEISNLKSKSICISKTLKKSAPETHAPIDLLIVFFVKTHSGSITCHHISKNSLKMFSYQATLIIKYQVRSLNSYKLNQVNQVKENS